MRFRVEQQRPRPSPASSGGAAASRPVRPTALDTPAALPRPPGPGSHAACRNTRSRASCAPAPLPASSRPTARQRQRLRPETCPAAASPFSTRRQDRGSQPRSARALPRAEAPPRAAAPCDDSASGESARFQCLHDTGIEQIVPGYHDPARSDHPGFQRARLGARQARAPRQNPPPREPDARRSSMKAAAALGGIAATRANLAAAASLLMGLRAGCRIAHLPAPDRHGWRVLPPMKRSPRVSTAALRAHSRVRSMPWSQLRDRRDLSVFRGRRAPRAPAAPSSPGGTDAGAVPQRLGFGQQIDHTSNRRVAAKAPARVSGLAAGDLSDIPPPRLTATRRPAPADCCARACTCTPRTFTGGPMAPALSSSSTASDPLVSVPVTPFRTAHGKTRIDRSRLRPAPNARQRGGQRCQRSRNGSSPAPVFDRPNDRRARERGPRDQLARLSRALSRACPHPRDRTWQRDQSG